VDARFRAIAEAVADANADRLSRALTRGRRAQSDWRVPPCRL